MVSFIYDVILATKLDTKHSNHLCIMYHNQQTKKIIYVISFILFLML